tara:strand:+ start:1105 stop:1524 length:420 start_codon:yes stop_codon:yes gene_type:complete
MKIESILQNLTIKQDNSIDDLTNQLNTSSVHDCEDAWTTLLNNYKKLCTYENIILSNNIHLIDKTFESFIMELNKTNKYYLFNFGTSLDKGLYTEEIHQNCVIYIKHTLNKAIETTNLLDKCSNSKIAYENIIQLIYSL